MQGARDQCSNRRRVSNKRRGFEVRVLINAKFYSIHTNCNQLSTYTLRGKIQLFSQYITMATTTTIIITSILLHTWLSWWCSGSASDS